MHLNSPAFLPAWIILFAMTGCTSASDGSTHPIPNTGVGQSGGASSSSNGSASTGGTSKTTSTSTVESDGGAEDGSQVSRGGSAAGGKSAGGTARTTTGGGSAKEGTGGAGAKGGATGAGGTGAKAGSSNKGGTSAAGTKSGTSTGAKSSGGSEIGGASDTGGAGSCSWSSAPESSDGKGKLTCYWFGQGTAKGFDECPGKYKTACGYCGTETGTKSQSNPYPCAIGEVTSGVEHISTPHFAAFPAEAYGGKNYCGMCVEVTYKNNTITATIVDNCASCPSTGDLDLSLSAAQALGMTEYDGSPDDGVTWKAVGCPTTDDIFVLYNGAKQTNQAYFQNVAFPIVSVTYDGKEAQEIGPFWGFQSEMAGKTVTLKDVVGHLIQGTMPSKLPGGSLGVQFPITCQ